MGRPRRRAAPARSRRAAPRRPASARPRRTSADPSAGPRRAGSPGRGWPPAPRMPMPQAVRRAPSAPPQDLAYGAGAEGHPDADLGRALAHRVPHDAVDPDRGEQQGHPRENREQLGVKRWRATDSASDRVQRLDLRDRLVGIDPVDRRGARPARATSGRTRGAGDERHRRCRQSCANGQEHLGLDRAGRGPPARRRPRRRRSRGRVGRPAGKPCLMRLPSGLSFGHHRCAKLSLMITTFGASARVGVGEERARRAAECRIVAK